MQVVIRANSGRLRTSASFTVSALIHGSILAWVALGPVLQAPEPRRSLYDQAIQGNEKKIVWYALREKLPDVTPAESHHDPRPARARARFEQSIVAGPRDDSRPPQLIYTPAPEIEIPKPLPLPNVVAAAPPARPVRLFAPPPEKRPEPSAPVLPDTPQVAANMEREKLPFDAPAPRPQPRPFTPPEIRMRRQAEPVLPSAPLVEASVEAGKLPFDTPVAGPRRGFQAPQAKDPPQTAPALPDAPAVAATVTARDLPIAVPGLRPQTRAFTAPPERKARAGGGAPLPATPEIVRSPVAGQAVAMPAVPRGFIPPPSRPVPASAPATVAAAPAVGAPGAGVPGVGGNAEAALAIVGLHPTRTTEFPTPPGSHPAGFSGGPKLNPEGGDGGGNGGGLVVPGLLARGGARDETPTLVARLSPTSRENLKAAAREIHLPPPEAPAVPQAVRVASPPDPRLAGRLVYTMAIEMPNVSSFSGSWIVWFAERQPNAGSAPIAMRPPSPLRKVDPKYIPAAVDERVEGKVRLFAVIRKDGRVDSVALLRHLDDRLDRSAVEALGKWQFVPALHNGSPVDVDAVFDIPFQLAPRNPGK